MKLPGRGEGLRCRSRGGRAEDEEEEEWADVRMLCPTPWAQALLPVAAAPAVLLALLPWPPTVWLLEAAPAPVPGASGGEEPLWARARGGSRGGKDGTGDGASATSAGDKLQLRSGTGASCNGVLGFGRGPSAGSCPVRSAVASAFAVRRSWFVVDRAC